MDLVAKDGMQSTVNIAVRYIRVSIPSMQISKRYCLIRAHTLTVLSVTKAKASSYRLSFKPRRTVHPILSNNPIFPAQNMKQNGIKNQGQVKNISSVHFTSARRSQRAVASMDEPRHKFSCNEHNINYHLYLIVNPKKTLLSICCDMTSDLTSTKSCALTKS